MLRKTRMRALFWAGLIILALFWREFGPGLPIDTQTGAADLAGLYARQQSDVMVEFEARVYRTLSDDTNGSRHQRFILEMDNGQTVLVAHNIDLAERVPLRVSDRLKVRGEYEYNPQGGVVHWTHRDPGGGSKHGWVELAGIRYD